MTQFPENHDAMLATTHLIVQQLAHVDALTLKMGHSAESAK